MQPGNDPKLHTNEEAVNPITEGVIWKQLLLYFVPLLAASFLQLLYNTADTIIVGRFVGKIALTAVGGSAGQIYAMVTEFMIGVSGGAGVIMSQAYGARDRKLLDDGLHNAIALALVIGSLFTCVGLVLAGPALRLAGAPPETLAKSILYVIDWIRGKVKSPEPFLAAYPGISDFRSFNTDEIRDQDQSQGFDIRIAFDSKRSIWALRFFEFSNNPEVPGQSFVTEVTVSKESGSVMMAIRTTCREPVGSPPAKVFRLWYIRHGLMQDEDLILTEAYTDRQYPISGKPIIVNGKSKDSCSHFSENLLLNSRRQFPLILVTDPKKYDAYKDIFGCSRWHRIRRDQSKVCLRQKCTYWLYRPCPIDALRSAMYWCRLCIADCL